MATELNVYSPVHFLETSPFGLTEISKTLTVADAYHVLSDALANIPEFGGVNLATDVFPKDCWHDHVSQPGLITLDASVHDLQVNDCYHVLIDEGHTYRVQPSYKANLGDLIEPNYLPGFYIDASFGHRADGEGVLPDLRVEGFAHTYLDAKLPAITGEGEVSQDYPATLDSLLPTLSSEGRSGLRFVGKLPYLEIDAAASGGLLGTLDKNLPGIRIEAAFEDRLVATLDKELPPLEIEAELVHQGSGDLDGRLPTLKITATQYGGHATLDRKLPAILIEDSEGIVDGNATLDMELPTVVIRPIGTGIDSGGHADPAYLQYEDRFTDYVLRYAR